MNQQETEAVTTQTGTEQTTVYSPPTDVFEREDLLELRIDLPGVLTDQIELKYEDGTLSVRATREESGGAGLLHREFGAAQFRRAFTVPEGYDPEKIEASLKNGVLTLTLAKAENLRPRRIEVN
ncbi:MAG: Hsp20/alpha crystallin family protein [Planctomycetota bacterium]